MRIIWKYLKNTNLTGDGLYTVTGSVWGVTIFKDIELNAKRSPSFAPVTPLRKFGRNAIENNKRNCSMILNATYGQTENKNQISRILFLVIKS